MYLSYSPREFDCTVVMSTHGKKNGTIDFMSLRVLIRFLGSEAIQRKDSIKKKLIRYF